MKKNENWLKAFCVARFDEVIGMMIEKVVPHMALSEREMKSVATLSFPESNNSNPSWEHLFFYRFRAQLTGGIEEETEPQYYFGYTLYCQRKDPSAARGVKQKSLVIISPFCFSKFFLGLVQIIGQVYFETESTAFLKSIFEYIHPTLVQDHKLDPAPCGLTTLLIHEQALFKDACRTTVQQNEFQEFSLCENWRGCSLTLLWSLWELVITETPLLIVADTPAQANQMVANVLSLVHPLRCTADFRPYATMYEDDIKKYMAIPKLPFVVLGTCNPCIANLWTNFPAVLHMERTYCDEHHLVDPQTQPLSKYLSKSIKPPVTQFLKLSKSRPLLSPSRDFLAQLREGDDEESISTNDWLLRMYFKEMNYFFLSSICPESKPSEFAKTSKFNEMYMKDRKRAERLYTQFFGTKYFLDFCSSESVSVFFNYL